MAITSQVLGTPLASSTDADSYTYTIASNPFTAGRLWEIRVAGFATSPAGFTVSGRGLTWTLGGDVTQGSLRVQRFVGTGTPDASGDLTLAAVGSQTQSGCRAVLREVWDTDAGTVVTEDVFTASASSGTAAAATVSGGASGDYLLGSVDAGLMPTAIRRDASGDTPLSRASLWTSGQARTFCFWFNRRGDQGVDEGAAGIGTGSLGGPHNAFINFEVAGGGADNMFARVTENNATPATGDFTLATPQTVGVWRFAAVTYSGAHVYTGYTAIDGAGSLTSLGTVTLGVDGLAQGGNFWLFANPFGDWWNGDIIAAMAFTSVLNATQLADQRLTLVPVTTPLAVYYLRNTGELTTDFSGNSLTLSGGTGLVAGGGAPNDLNVGPNNYADAGPFSGGATIGHNLPSTYTRYNAGAWSSDGSTSVATWTVTNPWAALVAMYRISADEGVVVNTTAARIGLRAATSDVEIGATTVDTEAASLGLRAAATTVDASTTVQTTAARLGLRAATTSVLVGATEVDTTAAHLGLRAATTDVEIGGAEIDTAAARLGVRAATTTVAADTAVDTSAARLGLRAATTTVALGAVAVDTTAAVLGLRAAVTTVQAGQVQVNTDAARLSFDTAVTTVQRGAIEIDTSAAALGLRAAVTTVDAGQRVNTAAARLGLRAATTSVVVGPVTVTTSAARLGLRAAVTDVDAGQSVVNTTAATMGLRAAVTTVDVGARTVDTEAAHLGLRAARTTVETPTTTVNTSAARLGFRAGTTTVAIGPVVVNTQAATLGLRAARTTVDTPVLRIVNTAAAVLGMRAARTTVQAFIPPVPDDESLWGRMIQLLQCAIEALNAQAFSDPMLKPAPDRAFIQPGGQVAWDDCCDCDGDRCGGQLWVRIVRAHPSNPYPVKSIAVIPCADDFATQLALGIVRCVHTMDDDGNAASAEQITADAHQAVCDMAALLKAIECCSDDIDQTVVVDQWLPLGASGGCAGGEWVAYTDAPIRCAPMILEPV